MVAATWRLWFGRVAPVAGLVGLLVAGCGIFSPGFLEAVARTPLLDDVQGQTLRIVRTEYPPGTLTLAMYRSLRGRSPGDVPLAPSHVVEVDLDSGRVRDLGVTRDPNDLTFTQPDTLRTDRWVVRPRDGRPGVLVIDRDGGSRRVLLDELSSDAETVPVALEADRLVAFLGPRTDIVPAPHVEPALVVVDLSDGRQTVIHHVSEAARSGVVLAGDQLIFAAVEPFDSANEPTTAVVGRERIDRVDLADGQREMLARAVGSISWHRMRLDDPRVLWVENTQDDQRMRGYDLDAGQVLELLNVPKGAPETEATAIVDFTGRAGLVLRQQVAATPDALGAFAFGPFEYVLMPYEGDPVTILRSDDPSALPAPPVAVLTDRYAAVMDSDQRTLVVYDITTGQTRRVTLFE